MRPFHNTFVVLLLLSLSVATQTKEWWQTPSPTNEVDSSITDLDLDKRFDWPWEKGSSLSGSSSSSVNYYAPIETKCPSGSLVRAADGINDRESDYVNNRHEVTNKNLVTFLSKTANLSDFDASDFIDSTANVRNISIGLAFSGGGYRAMLSGAGQMLGLDDRFDGAKLGGLLQSSTYLVGLSGGNWLVGSVVLNDFISIEHMVDGSTNLWELDDSIFNPNGINVVKTAEYYYDMSKDIDAKDDAGFDTAVTDLWGRALSHQFFNTSDSGVKKTWSSITDLDSFKDYEMPFPIVVSDGRTPGKMLVNGNSTIYEISPYELGSWDRSVQSFIDTKYLGSHLEDGKNKSDKCYTRFDNAGFIMGTSSTLFNEALIELSTSNINKLLKKVLKYILDRLSYAENDIAPYYPNPFMSVSNTSGVITKNDTLTLVDGGEDGQNVPYYPLIQNARDVDVIFSFDNSADTDESWPNGTSIVETYQRQFYPQGKGTPFPYVPNVNKIKSTPMFFGCNASELSPLIQYHDNPNINETDIPLVVYIPNSHHSYDANTSTYKMSYSNKQKLKMVTNGVEVSTRGNLTDDSDWAKCVGCAIIRRSQERFKQDQSSECQKCFQNYCWSGSQKQAIATSGTLAAPSSTSTSKSHSKKGDAAFMAPSPLLIYFFSLVSFLASLF